MPGLGQSTRYIILGSALAAMLTLSAGAQAHADEDWHYEGATELNSPAPRRAARQASAQPQIFTACGEPAMAAHEPMISIMRRVAGVWGAKARIYETPVPMAAFSAAPSCVFYNLGEVAMLLALWMNVDDRDKVEPLLYAIVAHELGHIVHKDASRRDVDPVKRELEADQFAGYTLSRLDISADNISDYYRMTGDDFAGSGASHGSSGQRADAFHQGWQRGDLGLSEQSHTGVGSTDTP
jgi:hypothetical protein